MEFKVIALKDAGIDIIDGDRGKNYPKKTEMTNQGHTLFLNNKNIINDYLDVTTGEFITENKSNELRKGKLIRDDIVMSTRGSVGNIGHYSENIALNNIRINSGMVILRNKNTQINTNYLYILLKSSYMKNQYLELISGSVQNQLPIRDLQHIKLRIPELIYQKKIVQVINNLEQKIFLNKKIISNFEQLSQTLFKQWFIDFEFPNEEGKPYKSSGGEMVESELGEIPKGWKVDNLSNIAEIVMGQSPKSETYNNENIGLPLLNGAADFKNCNISPNKYTSDAKKIGKKGDFVFGVRATIGLVTELDNTYAIGRGAGIATSLMKEGKEYLYEVLKKAFNEFQYTASGSVYLNISKNDLKDYKIVNPTNNTIKKYHSIVSVNTIQKENLIQENKNLTQLRDTLLPKLLSGEIEIPDELEV